MNIKLISLLALEVGKPYLCRLLSHIISADRNGYNSVNVLYQYHFGYFTKKYKITKKSQKKGEKSHFPP